MNKEERIFEWLMHNNVLYAELNKQTDSKLDKPNLSEKQNKEVEHMFKHRFSWDKTVYPIFSGEVCYLENASFIDKNVIKQNRECIKEWMLKHIFKITKEGLIFSNECKSDERSYLTSGFEYENSRICIPDLPQSYSYSNRKEEKRNCAIRLIKDCNVYSDILFKPNTYNNMSSELEDVLYNFLIVTKKNENLKPQLNKQHKLSYKSLINEDCELRYKIKECQDLYIDMEHMYYQPLVNFKSLKNFPDIVHGNLVFIDWDNIISLEGFPMLCENEVVFRTCRIPFDVKLPEGVTINKNLVCIDCVNDYNLLIGILKYNWNITGMIYTSLFTGKIDELRKIATKENWI